MWHTVLVFFGIKDEAGAGYAFWSGFAGDLSMFAALGVFYRKHNCHARWCFRLSRHQLDGTPYTVCRRHHPDLPNKALTAERLHHLHRYTHQERQP